MKKVLLAVTAFLGIVLGSSAAMAELQWDESLQLEPMRTESFRRSCRILWENRNRVQAECRDSRGRMHYNDVRKNCNGDLANIEGRITCIRGGGGRDLPPGSYQQTCHSCTANRETLSCICADTRGRQRHTRLNYRWCRGDIANMNGQLRCQR